MLIQCNHIQKCKSYSDNLISELRRGLSALSLGPDVSVIAVGSLARREASEQSDVDYFIVHDAGRPPKDILKKVNKVVSSLGLRPPSANGAFATTVLRDRFLGAIGGAEESNGELTRRMLFLLESDWLYGQPAYDEIFSLVIQRYIGEKITQHQLARFFLNDLIRYYRTICVDFEYKTNNGGKSWGDRNIKIMFSRKILYFSGVLAAAETSQSACEFKRAELTRLLCLTPMERISDVCGQDADRLLKRYDAFLGWMGDAKIRDLLKSTCSDRDEHTDFFRNMKNSGHHFSWELESLIHRRYAPTHSIYQALLF